MRAGGGGGGGGGGKGGGRHGWDGRLDAMAGWDAGEIKK